MRTLFTTAAVAALIALGLGSAAWGQQNRTTGVGQGTGGGVLGSASAAEGLGGPILTTEVPEIERRVSMEAGEFIGASVEQAQSVMERTGRRGDTGQAGRAVPVCVLVMVSYLAMSLVTSAIMNRYNRRIRLVER